MADWKKTVDAELDALRAREVALKKARDAKSKEELKSIAKRKGDLKMMKKKGISPVLPVATTSMPDLSKHIPDWDKLPSIFKGIPQFSPPTEDDAANFLGTPPC